MQYYNTMFNDENIGHGMTTLTLELNVPELENVTVSEDSLSVALTDGRRISVPLAWYPRLFHASKKERQHFPDYRKR
jgi:hypothetical protein